MGFKKWRKNLVKQYGKFYRFEFEFRKNRSGKLFSCWIYRMENDTLAVILGEYNRTDLAKRITYWVDQLNADRKYRIDQGDDDYDDLY